MSEDVNVKFGASLEAFNAGVASVKEKIEHLTEPLNQLRENLLGIGEAVLVAFAVEKIIDFIRETEELGEKAERTAQMLGMTTEEVTRLQFATIVTGGSADMMTGILEKLSRSMAAAASGGKAQQEAFKEAGVSYQDANGKLRPLNDMLRDLADSYAAHADGPEKTAMGMALMGRSAAEATPLLNQGSAGFRRLDEAADRAGVTMSEKTAHAFAESADKFNLFEEAMQGFAIRVVSVLEPAFDTAIDAVTRFIESINAASIAAGLESLVDTLMSVMTKIVEIALDADRIIENIGIHVGAIAQYGIKAFDTVHETKMFADIDAMNARVDGQLAASKTMFASWATTINGFITAVGKETANSSGGPDDRGGKKPAYKPPGDTAGAAAAATEAADAARAKVDSEVNELHGGLTRKKLLLDEERKFHQISDAEWVAGTKAAIDEEYNAEVALLRKELTLGNLKVSQKAAINKQISALTNTHETEMLQIEQKARADSVAGWTQSLTSIASVFHSQFSGLLHGTTSWAQAATNIFENFADQAVQAIEKMAIEWIAGQLGMKAAGTAASASAITSDAAVSFAGTAAFLSPVMGPAALGPAAGVQASVLAQLATLNVGTWGLPGDMPIMAHAGEAVIPAFESGQFRSAMAALASGGSQGGGGDTHHWHVNAVDAAGVAAFFKTHGDALAKTVSSRFNAQRSLRPSY